MTRYCPSRSYLWAGIIALALTGFSGWHALAWPGASVAALLSALSAALLLFLATRPPLTITRDRLFIGDRGIVWSDVRRVDRTSWISPLVMQLTLADESRVLVVYPGDSDSSNRLLRHLRRSSRNALIDGVPYLTFWGEEPPPTPARDRLSAPQYRLLREDDEAEVERLYRRLKTVGHLDSANSSEQT